MVGQSSDLLPIIQVKLLEFPKNSTSNIFQIFALNFQFICLAKTGVWLMHCHLDVHITWGLAMAFLVENGVGALQSIEPPPADLPLC